MKIYVDQTLIYFPDYMEGNDCGDGKYIGGATVYSHLNPHGSSLYKNSIECRITFKAENDQWRLMMRFVELDIPDKTYNGLCSDAVYVYDANTIGGRAVVSDLYTTMHVLSVSGMCNCCIVPSASNRGCKIICDRPKLCSTI